MGRSYETSEWVISIYGIPLAGFLILSRRVGDFFGRKKVFMVGLIVFAVSSLVTGLSIDS
jgi:MFS family permease